jgi:hypothetical protein
MIPRSVALTAIALALGCAGHVDGSAAASTTAGAAQGEASLGRPFELKVAAAMRFARESLTVEFEKVVEDSRCRVGATCVWEGDAVARLQLLGPGGERALFDLHTQSKFPREGTFQKFRIRLVGLAPARPSGSEIASDTYIATLVVSVNE